MPRKTDGMPFEVFPSPMKGKDGKNIVYVRPKSGLKISFNEIDDYCAKHYGLRPNELLRAMYAFTQAAGYWLSEGYRIETPLGTFAPKIGLRANEEFTDPKKVKGHDVRFEGMEYRSVKTFEDEVVKWLRHHGFRKIDTPDSQEIKADQSLLDTALQRCLTAKGFVTVASFSAVTGLSNYSARQQLEHWTDGENPRLLKTRIGRSDVYTET